jgi:hypothetical protein
LFIFILNSFLFCCCSSSSHFCMAINRVIAIGLSFSLSLSLALSCFFLFFSFLYSIFEAYIYIPTFEMYKSVSLLCTFSLIHSIWIYMQLEIAKKKKWIKTERESSFRLTYNKLSFLSSSYKKSYYASVDMQICV